MHHLVGADPNRAARPRGPGISLPSRLVRTVALAAAWLATPLLAGAAPAANGINIHSITLRDAHDVVVQRMVPADTFFVDVYVSHEDGFRSVNDFELGVTLGTAGGIGLPTWQGVRFRWERGGRPTWFARSTNSAGWRLFPELCQVDSTTNSTSPQRIRVAFSPTVVARADSTGWQLQAWSGSASDKQTGRGMSERVEWVPLDTLGRFAAGTAGSARLPISTPTTGVLRFRLVTNTSLRMKAAASAFVGITQSTARFGGGAADTNLHWTYEIGTRTYTARLDSVAAVVVDSIPALTDTTASIARWALNLSLPPGATPQDYAATLLGATVSAWGATRPVTVPLRGTVLGSGLAAGSATAEVEPHQVTAGTVAQPMTARLGFVTGPGETGVDNIRVALPAGWSNPQVTSVRNALGVSVSFTDVSTAESAIARLASNATVGPIRVDFTVTAPAKADSLGAGFVTYFDDVDTAVPEQVAVEGNPDLSGESGWLVRVVPAAGANLAVLPEAAALLVGDTLQLTGLVHDAFGNRREDPITWSTSGGAGSVNAVGRFRALASGSARVIASSGSLADTAEITVTDPGASVQISPLAVTPSRLLPGAALDEQLGLRLANPGSLHDTLDVLEVTDVSVGPPGAGERSGSWRTFELRDSTGVRWATGLWADDRVRFENIALPILRAASVRLGIFGAASLHARDGDSLGLGLLDASGVGMRSGRSTVIVPGAPLVRRVVDGMSAAQLAIKSLADGPLIAGSRRRLLASLRIPANGWDSDRLLRFDVANRGTGEPGIDLERIEAWLDDGDETLDTLVDQRLGTLPFTGDRWQITGLDVPVPVGGVSVLVTADVAGGARDGRTVRLALPTLPNVGVGMASGNSGPIDREVTGDEEVIGAGERMLVSASLSPSGVTSAGAASVPLLEVVLANGYANARRLRSLALTNTSSGAGSPAQLDGTFARIVLSELADASTDAASTSIAVGSFQNGRVLFDGLDLGVPAGGELRLQVTGDVDGTSATEGDRLAVSLASPQDLGFQEATTVGAAWPVHAGGEWTVDGFVASEATVRLVNGLTLAPLDGPVAALDVRLPGNGYLADRLHGVRVENLGDADPGEIGELRLFRDGGDGAFAGGSPDDADLGPLVAIGGQWQSAYLNEAIPAGGARFFVGLTVAAATTDSSTLRLAIPPGGVEMESAHDGPLDQRLSNGEPHVLSTRPVLASLVLDPPSSTIGQSVTARMLVRNVGTEALDGVTPSGLVAEGTADWQLVSGPVPGPTRLEPGESATFTWTLTPTTAGQLRFAANAGGDGDPSGLERRSLVARSNLHPVFTESDSLRLVAQQSMPSAVTLGQTGVVPVTLTLEHPGDASSSDIRFRRLRVRLEQEDGSPIVPAQLASAIEVREGTTVYLRRTTLETSGDEIDLTLDTPALLRPDDPVSLAVRLDIATSTSVPSFRLVVDDSTAFRATDAISDRPVRVQLSGQSYPIRSGLARLLSGGGALTATAGPPVLRPASGGQTGVEVATWTVAHSSANPTSADLRLNSILVRAGPRGTLASPWPWTRWRVRANGLVVANRLASAADTGEVRLDLVPAPVVQPGANVALRLEADLATGSAGARFVVDGVQPTQWDVRDVNSGELAPVIAAAVLPSDTLLVQSPAESLAVAPDALFPPAVAAGRSRQPAMRLRFRHPDGAGAATVRVDSLRVTLQAPDGSGVPMDDYLTAVRLTRRGAAIAALTTTTAAALTLPCALLVPGGGADTLVVDVDVAADAPAGSIELRVSAGALSASDANSGAVVTVTPEPPASWPLGSGRTTVVAPARELRVALRSRLPALVPTSDGSAVPAGALVLYHPGPPGSGPIAVDHLDVRAIDGSGQALATGAVAASLAARVSGVTLGASGTLASSAATGTIAFPTPVEIPAEDSVVLDVVFAPRAADPAGRFRLGCQAADIGVVQPASALLSVAVLAAAGWSFPMWTEAAGWAEDDLEHSYMNFPNPFAAGRTSTTFAFRMPGPGRATLRIWTARGEPVATLLDAASLPAGLRQNDLWDGRNGRGDVVTNGVYVAELDVRLDDGRRERVLRKVAVVR